jgi:hypothetical protein
MASFSAPLSLLDAVLLPGLKNSTSASTNTKIHVLSATAPTAKVADTLHRLSIKLLQI